MNKSTKEYIRYQELIKVARIRNKIPVMNELLKKSYELASKSKIDPDVLTASRYL